MQQEQLETKTGRQYKYLYARAYLQSPSYRHTRIFQQHINSNALQLHCDSRNQHVRRSHLRICIAFEHNFINEKKNKNTKQINISSPYKYKRVNKKKTRNATGVALSRPAAGHTHAAELECHTGHLPERPVRARAHRQRQDARLRAAHCGQPALAHHSLLPGARHLARERSGRAGLPRVQAAAARRLAHRRQSQSPAAIR